LSPWEGFQSFDVRASRRDALGQSAAFPAHVDKRNGTTTLFAALNALDGNVIGRDMQRRAIRNLSASSTPSRRRPAPASSCAILDNYATHERANGLQRHERLTFHLGTRPPARAMER